MQKQPVEGAKKPYSPPHLIIYGTVHELTQANQAGSKNDSASTKAFKHRTAI
jgi:hypothetical protein